MSGKCYKKDLLDKQIELKGRLDTVYVLWKRKVFRSEKVIWGLRVNKN